jgi:chemotaxis protein MotB
MSDIQPVHQEIIIVRRGGGDDLTAPKGGSWKIAYADFVTAMMAFFLVMWLINSANEATRAKVASYFNPIKMTDTTPAGRGFKEAAETKTTPGKDGKSPGSEEKPPEKEAQEAQSETGLQVKLMSDPYAALDAIAAQQKDKRDAKIASDAVLVTGDPFDPKAWEALQPSKAVEKASSKSVSDADLRPTLTDAALEQSGPTREDPVVRKLERALQGVVLKHRPDLDVLLSVERTSEGLLIKLGDNSGKGMFAVGSAKPEAALIDLVGTIGKLLKEQKGAVIVRGHTDNRPYRRGRMDNWQLSTARAHMASYMLVRGGFPETRIQKIEGHGAAAPVIAEDHAANANRRVEFLLVTPERE